MKLTAEYEGKLSEERHKYLALPTLVGAWSMALVLGRSIEC